MVVTSKDGNYRLLRIGLLEWDILKANNYEMWQCRGFSKQPYSTDKQYLIKMSEEAVGFLKAYFENHYYSLMVNRAGVDFCKMGAAWIDFDVRWYEATHQQEVTLIPREDGKGFDYKPTGEILKFQSHE